MTWKRALDLAELRRQGSGLLKHENKQIALFAVGEQVFAIDNRCPHEGYPLKAGSIDAESCVLTCPWHNWKFKLDTGHCVLGEDHVRRYPIRIAEGQIEVDLSPPPASELRAKTLAGLLEAVREDQYGRIGREIARLKVHGLDPLDGLRETLQFTAPKLKYGTTHAMPATADLLILYREYSAEPPLALAALTEAVAHWAHDTKLHPDYPFEGTPQAFDGSQFLDAIEVEDSAAALGMAQGALEQGLGWEDLEPWLARAALSHYQDFGHSAIHVAKGRHLIETLGSSVLSALLLPLVRSLCLATREDLLPEFKSYAKTLDSWPKQRGENPGPVITALPQGASIAQALQWTAQAAAESAPLELYDALLGAAAENLLRFDQALEDATDIPVSRNTGWLYFTHGITFANAVRSLCLRDPDLWPQGLLQMACFVGRNASQLDPQVKLEDWSVADPQGFFQRERRAYLDHGVTEPVYACHRLKTLLAVEEEIARGVSPRTQELALAGLHRYLKSPIKMNHVLRTARQNWSLVEQEA